ncbi:MAG: VCBS repeat-containing protein [Saprospiraceae bacterium]|nr:VCBS repeat-containing protein [Saprospiraceae bacterium]
MDGDCIPELIVQDTNRENLLIINAKTGLVKTKIKTYILYPYWNSFCVADVDKDGVLEIFVIAANFFHKSF